MKLTIPGILIAALIVASPAAFAQGYSRHKLKSRYKCVQRRNYEHDQAIKETHEQS